MANAGLPFVNTAEIDFGRQPGLRMLTVHRWLRSLGVVNSQVYGIMPLMQADSKIIRLKFHQQQDFQAFYEKYAGVQTMQENDAQIEATIRMAGRRETYVRLLDVPFETSGEAVKAALQPYGSVLSIRREKYMSSEENDYFPVLTGTVTVRITLEKHVPSYLQVSDQRVVVKYTGQPPTCMICNKTGHMAVACPAKKTGPRFVGRWAENTKQAGAKSAPRQASGKQWPTLDETMKKTEQGQEEMDTTEEIQQQKEEKLTSTDTVTCIEVNETSETDVTTQDLEIPSELVAIRGPEDPTENSGELPQEEECERGEIGRAHV